MQYTTVTVIGAGFSGLVAATNLQLQGYKVRLLDKGYGIGGRLASRTLKAGDQVLGNFDYGMQAFCCSDEQFQNFLQPLIAADIVVPWVDSFSGSLSTDGCHDIQYYRGKDSNRAIATHLAKSLEIQNQTRVVRFNWQGNHWEIFDSNDQCCTADIILLTAPVPQSLDLFEASSIELPDDVRQDLASVDYAPCLSLMVVFENPVALPEPGAMFMDGSVLQWMACNYRKGISPQGYAVTLLASPEFSEFQWETDSEQAIAMMLEAARPWFGENDTSNVFASVKASRLHRWKYSQPTRVVGASTLDLEHPGPLVMAGDAFSERPAENVSLTLEKAFLSGQAAAELISNIF